MSKKQKIQVHLPKMLSSALLSEHKNNSQKQSKHAFAELRKSIRENGFDEVLLVVPKEDNSGYLIVAGNHRFRAGVAEGMTEFPCVIRNDWSSVQSQIELVRRNYVRGNIDRASFTEAVNSLSLEASLSVATIMESMGFEDENAFVLLYQETKEQEAIMERAARDATEAASSDVGAVKLLDDLGYVLSNLVAKYGHTIPNSYIIFPTGGKNHMYVAANAALKKHLTAIAHMCASQNLDINVALAGMLAIGLDQTGFLDRNGREELVEAAEVDMHGSSDLDLT